MAGFDFHHPENNKEYGISKIYNKSWNAVIKEIVKCELLCRNCHSIEHSHFDEKWEDTISSHPDPK